MQAQTQEQSPHNGTDLGLETPSAPIMEVEQTLLVEEKLVSGQDSRQWASNWTLLWSNGVCPLSFATLAPAVNLL